MEFVAAAAAAETAAEYVGPGDSEPLRRAESEYQSRCSWQSLSWKVATAAAAHEAVVAVVVAVVVETQQTSSVAAVAESSVPSGCWHSRCNRSVGTTEHRKRYHPSSGREAVPDHLPTHWKKY